jgi:phosphatidylethanolamine/phosphatidyl-N-methylethanolamine N-methyltransferase
MKWMHRVMAHGDFGSVDVFYSKYYDQILRTGLVGSAQNRTHRAIEKLWSPQDVFGRVLEVGSGAGDHKHFVKHNYSTYYETDIRFPDGTFEPGTSPKPGESKLNVVREIADVMHLQYVDGFFDRVIATCLLLHLTDPESALLEIKRVTKATGGVVTILVPCEPGILLRLSRKFLTARKAKRLGFAGYELFNARDHINYISGLDKVIKYVFRDDKVAIRRLPFHIPSWNFNLYFVYTIYRG